MRSIFRFFFTIGRRVSRTIDIIGSCFSLPFFLPLFIKKERLSESSALLTIFFPNAFVWFSIYLYLLNVILLALGVTDADVQKPALLSALLVPLSASPSVHFGTFFFIVFFPLMGFYIYINQTEQWDKEALKEHFAEHVPTKEELEELAQEKQRQKEKRIRMLGFFKKWFSWSFSILLGLFVWANFGGEGATPWSEIFFIVLFASISLSAMFTILSEDRHIKKHRVSTSEKK